MFFSSQDQERYQRSQLLGGLTQSIRLVRLLWGAPTLGAAAAELGEAGLVQYLGAECGNYAPSSSIHCPPVSCSPFAQQGEAKEKQGEAWSFMVVPRVSHRAPFHSRKSLALFLLGSNSAVFAIKKYIVIQEAIQPSILHTTESVQGHSGQVPQSFGDLVNAVELRLIVVRRMRREFLA